MPITIKTSLIIDDIINKHIEKSRIHVGVGVGLMKVYGKISTLVDQPYWTENEKQKCLFLLEFEDPILFNFLFLEAECRNNVELVLALSTSEYSTMPFH